jgi:hypothetical protein
LFALAFYPLKEIVFGKAKGWLVLWLELSVLGILSPFGPSPGSVEGMIYTAWPLNLHVIGLPEVLLQSLALSVILHYWVSRPDRPVVGTMIAPEFQPPTLEDSTVRLPL